MNRARFRRLVEEAVAGVPAQLAVHAKNLEIVIEDWPAEEVLLDQGLDPELDTLYGLYEGVPLPEREHNFGMQLPDRITIYYQPILEDFVTAKEIREQIRITVVHEIAHFFGLDDDQIGELGYD